MNCFLWGGGGWSAPHKKKTLPPIVSSGGTNLFEPWGRQTNVDTTITTSQHTPMTWTRRRLQIQHFTTIIEFWNTFSGTRIGSKGYHYPKSHVAMASSIITSRCHWSSVFHFSIFIRFIFTPIQNKYTYLRHIYYIFVCVYIFYTQYN